MWHTMCCGELNALQCNAMHVARIITAAAAPAWWLPVPVPVPVAIPQLTLPPLSLQYKAHCVLREDGRSGPCSNIIHV